MRRRLNACCKGLLEPQPIDEFSKTDPQAMVGYLHRTVKDFIRKPDVWAGLLDATDSAFDPLMRLAIAHASNLKILPTNSLDGVIPGDYASHTRQAENFWAEVLRCIQIIDPRGNNPHQQLTLRLLEEVKDTVDEIVTRGVSSYDSGSVPVNWGHCSTVLAGTTKIRSFLHLAVKLQIMQYVDKHVYDVQEPDRVNKLSISCGQH